MEYIRTRIPITEVAGELGLYVNGWRARCWRTENHRNGDADPSIGFRKEKNTGRCFICDPHTWSNIDLVMQVRGCELPEAVSWITSRFQVPALPKGRQLEKREEWCPRFRASDVSTVPEMLVRSGLWRTLSPSEQSILPVLCTFTNRDTNVATISYKGIMQYSGVGSSATIAKALKHFEQMRFLKITKGRAAGPLRRVSGYQFTFDDPEFQALAARAYRRQRDEVDLMRKLRAEDRATRCKAAAPV